MRMSKAGRADARRRTQTNHDSAASRQGRGAGIHPLAGISIVVCLLLALVMAPAARAQDHPSSADDDTTVFTPPSQNRAVQPGNADNLQELEPLESSIEAGKYPETVAGLKGYLASHPGSARAHYDLGYVYFRTHEISGAVQELSRSLQLNVNDAQAHKILGLVCTFVGRYDLAETELRAAAQLEPDSAEIHYFLGRIYYTRQVFPLAQKEFETAIRLNPRYMKAYGNLGLVVEVLGSNEEAVKDYQTAAQMDEAQHLQSPWPYEYLSAHYNRQRQPTAAIEFARKALEMDPRCDLAYFDLAKAYQTQNDWQKAADEVQKAIAINSATPEYFYLLSLAMRRLGKIPESEAALKRFEDIHKNQNAMAALWRNASHQQDQPESSPAPKNETH
jgi:tetratricopeptide (TPR) repeat protein